MLTGIRQWVLKTMMKDQTGVMRTLPKKDLVDFNVAMTAEMLARNGIDPNVLKNANQVENVINQIEAPRNVQQGIRSTPEAKVFDMGGKEIPKGSKIMGGKQAETEAEILARIEEENKKGIEGLKQKMKKEQARSKRISGNLRESNRERFDRIQFGEEKKGPPVKDVDYDYYRELLDSQGDEFSDDIAYVVGDETEDTLKAMVKEAEDEVAYMKKLYDKGALDPPEDMAQGGRAGFKDGLTPSFDDYLKERGAIEKRENLERLMREYQEDMRRKKVMEQKQMVADGGRIGYFMGSANPKGLGLLREILNYMSKKGIKEGRFKGQDLSGLDMLKLSNPKAFNKMLEEVQGKVSLREGIMATDSIKNQQQALRSQRKNLTEKSLDVAKAMKDDQNKIKIRIAKETETTIIPQVKKQLMEGMGMSEEAAEKAARDMAEAASNIKPLNAPPEITDEGILQLENVLKNMETGGKKKRELNATGGRTGFDDGGMSRRTFLKLLGGLASIPIVGKFLKPLKTAKGIKSVPIIKTDNVPGKPEWFDALVNKVIIEGDDVTKKFATGERQSIHQKTLDDGSVVRVTEDVDDGAVRVEYENEANVFGDDVLMQYKKPLPDEGAPNPAAEFTTAESGPVSRQSGPDDFDLDVDEVGGSSISDLDSDVSKLKEYATGKKPTMKEFVQNKKRRDKASAITNDIDGAASDAVIRRQGDYVPEYDDYASGGIARMLGE